MRRKILVAEQADTVRGVAETVLRQNGFEVISVAAVDRAREVLQFTRPDLLIVGGDLMANDRDPFYEAVQQDSTTAGIPMLVIAPPGDIQLSLPPEVVIPRPFDPKDLVHRANVFASRTPSAQPAPAAKSGSTPLGMEGIDDDFLDAALGLDRIDVTDSEVMDKTFIGKTKKGGKPSDEAAGLDHSVEDDDEFSDSSRVESLIIQEDVSEIKHQSQVEPDGAPLSASGKLDILSDSDQYSLAASEAMTPDQFDSDHDYDWFVRSMREDNSKPATNAQKSDSGSQGIAITGTSELVDPQTKGPSTPVRKPAPSKSAGVEKFIDEFKKEIEQLRSDETDTLAAAAQKVPHDLSWEEQVETLSANDMKAFTQEFARELGKKVAEMIMAKIDSEKLLQLIKNEILARRTR
ncbi:MAG: hypothetical protein KKA42_13670 [candidate division Zixibacteria bacterium]|nr:hypothetical protein [candidate division Zixibacteria bacterium]